MQNVSSIFRSISDVIDTILPKGEIVDLPFQFQLPSKLPSSFRISRGLIDYSIVVKVQRNSYFDISERSKFNVNGILYLNPGDSCPVEIHHSKPVGCCSFFNWKKGHRFGLMLKLEKDQFLPGERIEYNVRIWNSSPTQLNHTQIELIRVCTLKYMYVCMW